MIDRNEAQLAETCPALAKARAAREAREARIEQMVEEERTAAVRAARQEAIALRDREQEVADRVSDNALDALVGGSGEFPGGDAA